jgi:glycerol uptake facilitator-like aquaporin
VNLTRRLTAEAVGSAFLLATVIGSGVMAERLSAGNEGLALLANAIATGGILYVLISALAPVSGGHFNPAVTLAMALDREIGPRDAVAYILAQTAGAVAGVIVAHAMFDLPLLQVSDKARDGVGQGISEAVATAGLLFAVFGTRVLPGVVAPAVALYITAAYWFTASTSFANPAVTLARTLSDTFAGIAPASAPVFIAVQIATAIAAGLMLPRLFRT